MVPLAKTEEGDVHSQRLAPVLEVASSMWFGLLPEARSAKKSQNRCTNGHTPLYISHRGTKIATNARAFGVK
jgi:hypothetical protein